MFVQARIYLDEQQILIYQTILQFIALLKQPSLVWSFMKKSSIYPDTTIFRSLKPLSGTFVILVNFLGHGAKPFGKHTNLYSLSRTQVLSIVENFLKF